MTCTNPPKSEITTPRRHGLKIIFLDIDGVLNAFPNTGIMGDKLGILKHILVNTNADIVLSSVWRLHSELRARVELALESINAKLLSQTPDLSNDKRESSFTFLKRWEEIQKWLEDNYPSLVEQPKFVILDDIWDFGPLEHRHVKHDTSVGLTVSLAKQAIKLLNE